MLSTDKETVVTGIEVLLTICGVILFFAAGLATGKIESEAKSRKKKARRNEIKKRTVKVNKKTYKPTRRW
jgi:hypothetical protein